MTATRDGGGYSSAATEIDEAEILDRLQDALAGLPRNDVAWTYTILGFDGSPYITRTLLPRLGAVGTRTIVHRIHRDDADPHPHNHPWRRATFRCVTGGYVDERWRPQQAESATIWVPMSRTLIRPGDVNELTANDFHRAVDVLPDTRTVGVVERRVQDWGFLVDGAVVPHAEYFRRKGHSDLGGLS